MADGSKSNARGCLIAAAVLFVLMMLPVVAFWIFVRSLEVDPVDVEGNTILEVDLGAVLGDGPMAVDLGPFFTTSTVSLWELTRAIDAAAEDSDIVGIRMLIRGSSIGWAGAEEVLTHLDDFRATGKPIHALLEADLIDDHDYFLATGADRILITPAGSAVINGLSAEAQFMRGTLDKLHIEPQIFMYKEYKSAGEGYANYEMSPHMRESLTAVLETTQGRLVQRIAERRSLTSEHVTRFMATGMAPAEVLSADGLVDGLGYVDELHDGLAEAAGSEEYTGISAAAYLSSSRRGSSRNPDIALVFGEGPIVTSAPSSVLPFLQGQVFSGARVAAHIREAAQDDDIQAIVFRVNSPGGSAVGSDLVRREIERARDAGKAVVISMGDMAASGGYWVSMGADAIVAHPTTLTGSIGVVFTKMNLDGFYEWLGTRVERITTTPGSDLLSSGPLDEGDEAGIRAWMDSVYGLFVAQVADGRQMELSRVGEIARGRVWAGEDALELGLVDALGGLDQAFAIAKESVGIDPDTKVPILVLPRQRSFWQNLMEEGTMGVTEPLGREVLSWARALAAPQVQARAPEFRIY